MTILEKCSQQIEVFYETAHTTTEPTYASTWSDNRGGQPSTVGTTSGSLSGATPVVVVPNPPSGFKRDPSITITNGDSVSHTFTVQSSDLGHKIVLAKITLAASQVATFDEGVVSIGQSSGGSGVPTGGTTNQVLAKASDTNFDTAWVAAGGGIITNPITFTGDPTGLEVVVQQYGQNINGVFYGGLTATDNTASANGLLTLNYGTVAVYNPVSTHPGASSLTSLDMSNVTVITGNFTPTLASLTTLNLSSLTTVLGNFSPTLASMTSLSLPAMTDIDFTFNPTANALTTLDLSGVTDITTAFNTTLPALTTLDLSALVHAGSHFAPTLNALTTLSLPNCVDGTLFGEYDLLTSVSLPVFADDLGGSFDITAAVLTSIALPSIVNITGGIGMGDGCPNLTTFTLGTTLKNIENNIDLSGLALSQATVNALLVQLVGLDGTNGTTLFENQTVDLSRGTSAAPSGAGITAVVTLTSRGCTVTTN